MSKILSGTVTDTPLRPADSRQAGEALPRRDENPNNESARLIGQPEGPFGTAAVAKLTVLLRSLGASRFSKFETLEIAKHGVYIACSNPKQFPFQVKTTLLELQLFLGDPASPATRIIRAMGRIEEIRPAVDLPIPAPSGYVVRLVQVGNDDSIALEKYVYEHLLSAAM
ncbi:MAG: hypothetical protein RLZZ488_2798 [Pseudomonadota bacterium]|jgi:hypothetical protein